MTKTLLIVEDDPGLQSQMRWCFNDDVEVHMVSDRESAISHLRRYEPAVVTLDLGLPPDPGGSSEGFKVLEEILQLAPKTKVIVVTGREENENAVRAIGMGATDFFQKPLDADILNFVVERAFQISALENENLKLKNTSSSSGIPGVIANSPAMLKVCRTLEKVAPADVSTLILGETGTGKEVLAKAVHALSPRVDGPFAAINCAAIPENLLESELFGHEKGAFTGAHQQKKGKVELANGGTLFLDEIGDMPASLQPKMLRFLQERVIERVGGVKQIPVDVRVVCATHQDISELIQQGQFREDLYYRVSEISLSLPPLREREGDSVLIAQSLLKEVGESMNRGDLRLSEEAMAAIRGYDWPGNVREMINKIKRAAIMADGRNVTPEDLELESQSACLPEGSLNLKQIRDNAEKTACLQAIKGADGNMAKAARILGITRPTLYSLFEKHGIDTE